MKNLKKIIFGCSCILFLSVSNAVFATNGTVTGKTVRIRESADASSNIVTNAYRNDTVNVIETSGDWYKVEYEGKTGYISKEYVEVKENIQSSSENTNAQQQNTQTNQENNTENTNDKITITKESNLKLLPNFSSKNLGVIQADTEIKIEQEFNNWVQISAGSNNGWVLKNNISGYTNSNTSKPEEPVQVTIDANTDNKTEEKTNNEQNNTDAQSNSTEYQKQKGYINIDTARVRETAGGKIIGNIDINDEVTIIGEEGDWYKITCDEYQTGYVSKSLITIGTISSRSSDEPRKQENEDIEKSVEESVQEPPKQEEQTITEQQQPEQPIIEQQQQPEPASNKGQEIVDYAKSFLGSRYVSGGTSPSGFDCSGFTQYVYSHFGYSIARVASAQASNGTEVSRNDLQLGDILIFQDYGRTSIGHVGIYIGDGNFIHAANPSRGVVIDNLNSNSYYNIRFVCARRII